MDAVAPTHVLIPMLVRALAHGARSFGKCGRGPCSGKAPRVHWHKGHRGWIQIQMHRHFARGNAMHIRRACKHIRL
eukprot:3832970-Alexandrium_andersonii.AAC.1